MHTGCLAVRTRVGLGTGGFVARGDSIGTDVRAGFGTGERLRSRRRGDAHGC